MRTASEGLIMENPVVDHVCLAICKRKPVSA